MASRLAAYRRDRANGRPARLRWWVATQLNRLPGQCWADLVTWALGWHKGEKHTPWSPVTSVCRRDLAANGGCYCGKLRPPGAMSSRVDAGRPDRPAAPEGE